MQHRSHLGLVIALGIAIAGVSVVSLVATLPVQAQCGSQASSCKNCHEVQAKDPVNNDGKSWHTSHAFGDFCYICHGGNQQATDETAAHAGLVAPLSDIQASCGQCHPNDLQARAQVYAAELGVQLGASSPGAANTATPSAATAAGNAAPTALQPAAAALGPAPSANDASLVDYVQRYNENVLGKFPTNWGNVILLVMIGAMFIGGGALVVTREGLIKISFKETKPVDGEFPADVVDMVPGIAKLKPNARKSLRRLLEKPDETAEVLTSIDRLTERNAADQKGHTR